MLRGLRRAQPERFFTTLWLYAEVMLYAPLLWILSVPSLKAISRLGWV